MNIKRKTESAHVARIKVLEERIAGQSRVIQIASRDAIRAHTAACAAFQLAAAAEFLLQGNMPDAARDVLTAMQIVESRYQRATNPPAVAPGSAPGNASKGDGT